MAKKLVTVVIPVYKTAPDAIDRLSLKQCAKTLGNYPIVFVCPQNFDITAYVVALKDVSASVIKFPDHYFENIAGYNQLMLSRSFYKQFLHTKYILIHQLDAFVFSDELAYWCNQNYDYIGAPNIPHKNNPDEIQFLKGYSKILSVFNRMFKTKHKVSNVGNGGLSLRKTRTFYWLLRLLPRKVAAWGINNEDGFFKYWGNVLYPLFRLPDDETALRFSVEESPARSVEKLSGKMPFGCHAFQKFEPEFWNQYIHFLPDSDLILLNGN